MKYNGMKYIWLSMGMIMAGSQAFAATWTTSADIRERYQFFNNYDFNSTVNNNSWEFDSRLYIKAKGDFGNGLTVFLQPQAVMIKNHTVARGTQT